MPTTEIITAENFDAAWMENLEKDGLWIRAAAFDNRGESADRYTIVVEVDPPWGQDDQHGPETFTYFASANPFHPQGVGMTGEPWQIGGESNVLIDFEKLPEPVQRAVWSAAGSHWMLGTPREKGYVEFNYDFSTQRWIATFSNPE